MIPEVVYLHYLNALLEGDKNTCKQIVSDLIENNTDVKDIYVNLFQRTMYRIGQLWEKERCTVAEEHIATNITESLLELTSSKYSNGKRNGKLAVITCVDREFHELGAKMVAGFIEMCGWDTLFLGSNTPHEEIIRLIKNRKPDLIGISNNFYINVARLFKLIDQINSNFPNLPIIVGGQSLADAQPDSLKKFTNVSYINSLDKLEEYLNSQV